MVSKASLHVRVMGIAIFVLVILFASLYFYYVQLEEERLEQQIAMKTDYLTRIVAMVISDYLATKDFEPVKRNLADLMIRDTELASFRVKMPRGDVYYLVSRHEALSPDKYFERTQECRDARGQVVATLTVGWWRPEFDPGASNISLLNSIIAVDLAVLAGLFLHLLMRELVTRPLEEFVDATKRVAGGDLTELAVRPGSSLEEQRLWASFNDMLVKLRESHQELYKINTELEERVVRRTEELRRTRDFSQTVIATVADGIYTVDDKKLLRVFNAAAEKLTGLSAENVIGRPCYEVLNFPFCRTNCILERLHRRSARHEKSNLEEYLEEVEEGGRSWLVAGSVFDDKTGFAGGVETIKDLSYTRRLQHQIRQVERLTSLGVLSAGVAHEINNPLSNIKVFAQLLQEDLSGKTEPEEEGLGSSLARIIEQTDRASEIVRKMLEFARQSHRPTEELSVAELITQSLAMVNHTLNLSGVQVRTDVAGDIPPIHGNRLGLQQVLINLFNNARQAMRDGGTLQVRAWSDDPPPTVSITVADSGGGIPAADLGRIFDPFFTTKEVGEGTGLGLSISYGIIKEHGGEILARSSPGEGTTFTIMLPIAGQGMAADAPPAEVD